MRDLIRRLRRARRFVSCIVLALSWLIGSPAPAAEAIGIAGGQYLAALPPDWDGKSALPLVLFIHGYGESAAQAMAEPGLAAAATGQGALFIAPDGSDGNWSFTGAPHQGRDDIAFLHAVIEDAEKRWPIDPRRVVASGFSIGASMVWELACHSPRGFTAFLPISGTFWVPYPERCPGGPVTLRQVHGYNDHTFPLAGRRIGLLWRQGNTAHGFEILRGLDRCQEAPDSTSQEGRLECSNWTGCGAGRLQLCLHSGDHEIDPAWLADGLHWAFAR
ncbi:MAG: polyhydroxybutyrate depolymerase [Rhodospirillales bacterium]|nr:polyhydroxybutyrate depolymerase [Rhodospirillales bacterium]